MSEQITQNTFKVKLGKTDFEQVLKLADPLVEEITLNFDTEGLTFRIMDPSHVCMLDIALPNNNFEVYEIDANMKIGLRIKEVLKILKEFNKNDFITMSVNSDNNLILENKGISYKIKLIESSEIDQPLPRIPYNSYVTLYGNDLKTYLKKINALSDYLTISVDNNICTIETKSDNGECEIKLYKGQEELIEIGSNGDFNRSTFSIDYLMPYLKAMSNNYAHTLSFSGNKPLRVSSKIFNLGRVDFYLAPRIEN